MGSERVVGYGSRKLNAAEQNYNVTEREALAVVWGMKHFRPYLYGQRFKVLTDHRPITFLKTMKDPKGKFARWLQEVSSYDYDISYRPGTAHRDADALSRIPSEDFHECTTAYVTAISIVGNREYVIEAQKKDVTLGIVLKQLSTGKRPSYREPWKKGPLRAYRRTD